MKNYQSVKYFQECQNRKNLLSADEESMSLLMFRVWEEIGDSSVQNESDRNRK